MAYCDHKKRKQSKSHPQDGVVGRPQYIGHFGHLVGPSVKSLILEAYRAWVTITVIDVFDGQSRNWLPALRSK